MYFTDDVDEFAVKMIMSYKEKEFKSVSSGDLGIEPEENHDGADSEESGNKELFESMKNILSGKVKKCKSVQTVEITPCMSVHRRRSNDRNGKDIEIDAE